MDNAILNIGDSLVVNVMSKIRGKIRLSAFSDVLTGITADRSIERSFRVSEEDIFWTEWLELTDDNLLLNEYTTDDFLHIQIKYTRIGTDAAGEIDFVSINFTGTKIDVPFVAPTLTNSIFNTVLGTEALRNLTTNLFKKLYYRGIVADYITRGANVDKNEDNDDIDLFHSIAKYFAIILRFFKRFETFYDDIDLMRDQVRQLGLYFDESSITLAELQYMTSHYLDEIRRRGTEMIFKRSGYILKNGNTLPIDGEFVRLTRNKSYDELLYEFLPNKNIGWCLGISSPIYKGTCDSLRLNKTKEITQDFQNLSNYITTGNCTLVSAESKKVLEISANNSTSGLGRLDDTVDVQNNLYVADSKMDYEIVFSLKVLTQNNINSVLKVEVEGFDSLKNKLADSFVTPNGDNVTGGFLNVPLKNFQTNVWYRIRAIIHCYSSAYVDEEKMNISFGTNLYYNNPFTKYIIPKIQIQSTNSEQANAYIWDYKIRPLIRGTNISTLKNGTMNSRSLGFIQTSNIFYTYVHNNNNSQSEDDITTIISKYLYPYNTNNLFTFISN